MPWWERERLFTDADRKAIKKAIYSRWEDIDEDSAETEAGRAELHSIIMRKFRHDEFQSQML